MADEMDVDEESIVTMETEQSMRGQVLMTEQEYCESCEMPADLVADAVLALDHSDPEEPPGDSRRAHIRAPWNPAPTKGQIVRFKQGQRDRRNRLRVRTLVQAGRRSTRSRGRRSRARPVGLPSAKGADPSPGPPPGPSEGVHAAPLAPRNVAPAGEVGHVPPRSPILDGNVRLRGEGPAHGGGQA